MFFFGGPRSTLERISEPARVRVQGRVVSPDGLASPMGGGRAALYQLIVGVLYRRAHSASAASWSDDQVEVFDRLASEVFCDVLLIEAQGGILAVPAGATFEFPFAERTAVLPVSSPLPSSLSHVTNLEQAGKGVLSYQELSLSHGDPVRFEGWAAPLRFGTAYRSAGAFDAGVAEAGATHLADLGRGPAVIRDLSMEGTGFGQSRVMRLISRWIGT